MALLIPNRIEVHHYIHFDAGQLAGIESSLSTIKKGIAMANAALERLQREVEETRGVANSAVALLNGLGQYIRDNVSDQNALNELADKLDADQAALAASIAANPLPGETTEPPTEPPAEPTPP